MKKQVLMSAIALSILYSYSTNASANTLTGAEIQKEIVGTTLKYRTRINHTGTMTYRSNGMVSWTGSGGSGGAGQWRIEGDKLCTIFNRTKFWRGWPWRCQKVRKVQGKYRYNQLTYWK